MIVLIIVFGIGVFVFSRRNQEPLPFFSATVRRDCAPWDGPAFTISIPIAESGIAISIYQAPDIQLPAMFWFPDETMQEGNALLLAPAGMPEQLRGRVSFQSVEQGKPVEGKFDLSTATGRIFKGQFKAAWDNEIVYCG